MTFPLSFSHADGVLLFSNDDVLHQITAHTGLLSRQKPSGSISLRDMNSYISASLAGVLQPLGSKPRRLKGKLREMGFKGGVDVTGDKKERKKERRVKFATNIPLSLHGMESHKRLLFAEIIFSFVMRG